MSVKLNAHTEFHEFISEQIPVSVEEELQHPKFIKFENMLLKPGAILFLGTHCILSLVKL